MWPRQRFLPSPFLDFSSWKIQLPLDWVVPNREEPCGPGFGLHTLGTAVGDWAETAQEGLWGQKRDRHLWCPMSAHAARLGRGPSICPSNKLPVRLLLLVQGPPLEDHCSRASPAARPALRERRIVAAGLNECCLHSYHFAPHFRTEIGGFVSCLSTGSCLGDQCTDSANGVGDCLNILNRFIET